jgi:thymidylate synthase (methanogen type)
MELNEGTIEKTWHKMLYKILHSGQAVDIQGYGRTLEAREPMMVNISRPLEDRICEGSGWGLGKLEEYYKQCTTPENKFGFDYTYGERFLAYDNGNSIINQVEENMSTLETDSSSRRAVSISWMPEQDGLGASHPPCMIFQQRLVRDGRLNLIAYFRSNDAWGAVPSNYYMLSRWLEEDAEHLGVGVGKLHIITLAHIYQRDWKESCVAIGDAAFYECLKELM